MWVGGTGTNGHADDEHLVLMYSGYFIIDKLPN